jgi:hypothetical protein
MLCSSFSIPYLADNGGPTKTMAVNTSDPAYKAGGFVYYNGTDGHYIQGSDSNYYKLDPSYTQFSPSDPGSDKMTADQRGVTRGTPATIGAYSECFRRAAHKLKE